MQAQCRNKHPVSILLYPYETGECELDEQHGPSEDADGGGIGHHGTHIKSSEAVNLKWIMDGGAVWPALASHLPQCSSRVDDADLNLHQPLTPRRTG